MTMTRKDFKIIADNLKNLVIDLKSLTEGMGTFEHEFEQMKTVDNKQLADSLVSEYSSNNKEE